jgi:hypothetical protein
VIKVFLEFYSCFLQGLELFLCGWDVVWDEIDVDRRCYTRDELVRGLLQHVVFPGVVSVFCNW